MLPWVVGPLVSGGAFFPLVGHLSPLRVLPGLVVVPGAMLALGVSIVRRLRRRPGSAPTSRFEPPPLPPSAPPMWPEEPHEDVRAR